MEEALFILHPFDKIPVTAELPEKDTYLLSKGYHNDSFSILGSHTFKLEENSIIGIVVRIWNTQCIKIFLNVINHDIFRVNTSAEIQLRPNDVNRNLHEIAFKVEISEKGKLFFCGKTPKLIECNEFIRCHRLLYELNIQYGDTCGTLNNYKRDPYNFGLLLPNSELEKFQSGLFYETANLMGSHHMIFEEVEGIRFSVWAPNARNVSVVGDWNSWNSSIHPMRKRVEFGVWELFLPDAKIGDKYGYRIVSCNGNDYIKIDPYAQEFENPPKTASIISNYQGVFTPTKKVFLWEDSNWIYKREKLIHNNKIFRIPMSIYELHLPSWLRGEYNSYLNYKDYADPLIKHVKRINATHVEFLPLVHHPYDKSWGYQVSGLYAPYSRLGSCDDLKYLINELHKNNIGVFLDFVLAHFVKDEWALIKYDGQPLYEYADSRESENKCWGTMKFNFSRKEVRNFLFGSAYHWIKEFHFDGLRIDAVSSMIYKNYCREPGEWIPNELGGDSDLAAVSFLKELNMMIHAEFPGVFTMAEESTSWRYVTNREHGFDAKWDLGWMNDTLSYLCHPAPERWKVHSKLTFRSLYLSHERWILPLSHDEVVSGKGSLLDKSSYLGTPFEEKLCNLRALYGYQIGMPGRPLLFMGGEFAQGREWDCTSSIDWHESLENLRSKMMLWVSDIFELYREHEALHAGDDENWNFQWINCDDAKDNILVWLRKYQTWHNDILVICNFSGINYFNYSIEIPHGVEWKVLINSDDWKYGGSMHGIGAGLLLDIPRFSCLMLKPNIEFN